MVLNPGNIVTHALDAAKPTTDTLSDAWQLLIGDRVAAWRLRNAAKIQIKVHEELKRLGLSLNLGHIPERYAFSWFEEATKQDEPEIQTIFARLLSKASGGDKCASDRRFLEIVSRFTPDDAQIFYFFFDEDLDAKKISHVDGTIADIDVSEYDLFKAIRHTHGVDRWRSVEHLLSLGVLERRVSVDKDSLFQALTNLETGSGGQVFPRWGSLQDLEIVPSIAATSTGLALHRALST